MNKVTIEYSARQDKNYDKAFKPEVFVNGKWIYTISRCKKTMRGALNEAKRLAEGVAKSNYPSCWNEVTIKQR